MWKNLDENERKTWANYVKLLLQTFGFNFFCMQQGVGDEPAFLKKGILLKVKKLLLGKMETRLTR